MKLKRKKKCPLPLLGSTARSDSHICTGDSSQESDELLTFKSMTVVEYGSTHLSSQHSRSKAGGWQVECQPGLTWQDAGFFCLFVFVSGI